MPLSREVFKAALILQRRMSFSRSARLYSVEPAPHFLFFNEAHKKRDNYADPWIDACSGPLGLTSADPDKIIATVDRARQALDSIH